MKNRAGPLSFGMMLLSNSSLQSISWDRFWFVLLCANVLGAFLSVGFFLFLWTCVLLIRSDPKHRPARKSLRIGRADRRKNFYCYIFSHNTWTLILQRECTRRTNRRPPDLATRPFLSRFALLQAVAQPELAP